MLMQNLWYWTISSTQIIFSKKNLTKTKGSIRKGGKLIANIFFKKQAFSYWNCPFTTSEDLWCKRILQNSFFNTHRMFSLFIVKCRYLLCSNYSVDTEEIIAMRSFFSENIWKANFTFTLDGSNPAKNMMLFWST